MITGTGLFELPITIIGIIGAILFAVLLLTLMLFHHYVDKYSACNKLTESQKLLKRSVSLTTKLSRKSSPKLSKKSHSSK
ncbi:hypothetical protein DERF_007996 [Dermatophagoides farinae]|uniref:Uncharacterized protein n=1 Tax=Dermatophagoides farinae TaxID=6954 RepID=A0A922L3T8_DERFA|nr:hypothetical protein DERF_007996 [Dermatophagoides farinae]